MRKELLFMATAALAVSSCTQVEVDEVAATQKEPIRFEQFINKATRADDVTTANLTKFKVLGEKYTSDGQSEDIDITVTKSGSDWTCSPTMYWEEGVKYCFAAINLTDYAYGEFMFESNSATDYKLCSSLFTLAARESSRDIVAAICPNAIEGKASGNSPVSFSFKHVLAKVQFTFENEDVDGILMIMDAEVQKAQGTSNFTLANKGAQSMWDNYNMTETYPLDDFVEFQLSKGATKTYTLFLLPQAKTDFQPKLKFNFMSDENDFESGTRTLDLFTGDVTKWEAGKAYNYKIKFASKTPEGPESVEFAVSVDSWGAATDAELEQK